MKRKSEILFGGPLDGLTLDISTIDLVCYPGTHLRREYGIGRLCRYERDTGTQRFHYVGSEGKIDLASIEPPDCDCCGEIMILSGKYYRCINCGTKE